MPQNHVVLINDTGIRERQKVSSGINEERGCLLNLLKNLLHSALSAFLSFVRHPFS